MSAYATNQYQELYALMKELRQQGVEVSEWFEKNEGLVARLELDNFDNYPDIKVGNTVVVY